MESFIVVVCSSMSPVFRLSSRIKEEYCVYNRLESLTLVMNGWYVDCGTSVMKTWDRLEGMQLHVDKRMGCE